jgi:hypothetical protein
MMKKIFLFSAVTLLSVATFSQTNSTSNDSIYAGFKTPPNTAMPRVWWHWMNGNITKDGIRKDLEWMHRVGIGGFQNFDAALATPQIVEKRLTYMTPEWKDAFRFTTKLADSLHLEMAIAGSPGWSESGGPWVKPEDGMKKIVWTTTRVKGGASNVIVPKPSGVTGPFQNIPKGLEFGESPEHVKQVDFYKDVAVVAYKLPEADKSLSDLGASCYIKRRQFYFTAINRWRCWNNCSFTKRFCYRFWDGYSLHFLNHKPIKAITMVGGGNPGVFWNGC